MLGRQHCALWRLSLALEIITDVLHLNPLDAWLAADVLDQSLQHENHMWMAADIRMDGHRKAKVVVLSIEIVEMISPQVLNVFWVHPAVGIRSFLDKHHWGQVVKIPILHEFRRQHCLFWVGNGVARQVSGVGNCSCSVNMSHDSNSLRLRKNQLRNIRTAGISTRPVSGPFSSGFIQWVGCLL